MVHLLRRHQQTLMIFITLLVIISFAGFYSHTDFLERGSTGVGVMYGRKVPVVQYQKAGRKAELCRQIGMSELLRSLVLNPGEGKDDFVWNSFVLKHEAGRLGIEPTEDEVFDATQKLPVFQTDGKFDSAKYGAIVQNVLPHLGFTVDDLADLVADDLRLQKIKAVLGSTFTPSEHEIRAAFTRLNQKTEASVIRFKLDDFLAAAQVSDEDVKKRFEERKGSLKTEEMRKVKFVSFVLPATAKPLEDKNRAEELTKLQKQAEDFSVAMTEKDAKFEDVAAKLGVKILESPEFPAAQTPEIFGGSREVGAAAFKLNTQDPNSDIVETDRGYYVLQLAGITPPRPLSLDEARANLTTDLKRERAQEALNLKAADVRNKIEAEIKAGKIFAVAAQAVGVKAEDFPAFSAKEPKVEPANSGEIMQTASELNEGQLSTAVPTPDGSLIVYVTKRLPIDDTAFQKDKAQYADGLERFQRAALFQQWLKLRRAAAQIQPSYRG